MYGFERRNQLSLSGHLPIGWAKPQSLSGQALSSQYLELCIAGLTRAMVAEKPGVSNNCQNHPSP
jgi:hypothetical protein